MPLTPIEARRLMNALATASNYSHGGAPLVYLAKVLALVNDYSEPPLTFTITPLDGGFNLQIEGVP